MSVILDIDIPSGCGACILTYLDYDEDGCPVDRCVITNKIVWNDFIERPEFCPLIKGE